MNRELLGDKHLNVALSLNNLAIVLELQGSYKDAENFYCESLTLMRELLGDKDLNVVTVLNNLAYILELQGSYKEAESLYYESLALNRELMGNKHENVACGMRSIGLVMALQNKDKEAYEWLEKAYDITLDTAGAISLDSLKAQIYLAIIADKRGDVDISSEHLKEALVCLHGLLAVSKSSTQAFIRRLCDEILPQYGKQDWVARFDFALN